MDSKLSSSQNLKANVETRQYPETGMSIVLVHWIYFCAESSIFLHHFDPIEMVGCNDVLEIKDLPGDIPCGQTNGIWSMSQWCLIKLLLPCCN